LNKSREIKQSIVAKREVLQSKLVLRQFNIHDELIELVKVLKAKIKEFEKEPETHLSYIREFHRQIEHLNRLLGELAPAPQTNIEGDVQVNIVEVSNAARRLRSEWFSQMDATLENGKLVFNSPSSELLDDYRKWEAKQLQESQRAEAE
jgi:hypothetical protein